MRRVLRPPIRGVPRGGIVRGGGRGRGGPIRNAPVRIDLSDSESYSNYSDNLPIIKRKTNDDIDTDQSSDEYSYSKDGNSLNHEKPTKTNVGADLVSDYEYYDSFEEGVPVVAESQPIQNFVIETSYKKNSKQNNNSNINIGNEMTPQVSNESIDSNNAIENDQQAESSNEISVSNGQVQRGISNSQKNQDRVQEDIEITKEIRKSNDPSADVSPQYQTSNEAKPAPIDLLYDTNLPCYRVVWKKTVRSKSHIQFVFNDEIMFHSKEKKTKIGNCHIICSDENIDCYSKSYIGSLKKSQNRTRFTLFTPQGEQYQTHEGEVMGLSFYDPKDIKCYGVRAFRIALPKKLPYFPSTKEMNLSKIAQKNVKSDDIQIFSSKLPELFPGPVLKLQFGNVHVVSSVKNFILEDENGNVIFMIYKSSNGMCSVRTAPPITPLIAFALSIAIITSNK